MRGCLDVLEDEVVWPQKEMREDRQGRQHVLGGDDDGVSTLFVVESDGISTFLEIT